MWQKIQDVLMCFKTLISILHFYDAVLSETEYEYVVLIINNTSVKKIWLILTEKKDPVQKISETLTLDWRGFFNIFVICYNL